MNWFTRKFSKSDGSSRQHVVNPQASTFIRAAGPGLRPNMWVVINGEPGILTQLGSDGQAEVMLTLPDGTNKLAVRTQVAAIRQARLDEIPASRRPSRDIATAMGYHGGTR